MIRSLLVLCRGCSSWRALVLSVVNWHCAMGSNVHAGNRRRIDGVDSDGLQSVIGSIPQYSTCCGCHLHKPSTAAQGGQARYHHPSHFHAVWPRQLVRRWQQERASRQEGVPSGGWHRARCTSACIVACSCLSEDRKGRRASYYQRCSCEGLLFTIL